MCMMGAYDNELYSEKVIKNILMHTEEHVSDEIKEYAIEKVFLKSRYLFVERRETKYLGYCTHCGHEYEVEKLKHNSTIHCKECGSECVVKLTRYGRKSLIDRACFIYYEKSVVDPDAIVANGFYAERYYGGDYKKVKTSFLKEAVYVFKPGSAEMVVKLFSYYYGERWKKSKSIYSFNNNSLANYPYSISYNSVDKAVKNTPFKYSMWEEYVGSDMLSFFELYTKYPLIESLTKVGMKELIRCKIHGENMMRCINWRGKTIYKMLKIGKKDLKEIRESKVFISPLFLKLYQRAIRDNSNLGPHEVKVIERAISDSYGYEKLEEILEYCSTKKAYKYLAKQKQKGKSNNGSLIITWRDYIEDCKKLKMDLNKEDVLFPKDVVIAHQNTIRQIKYKEDKALNKKIEKRLDELNKLYCFEYKELFIRPVTSSLELIDEGKALNHCVGGYSRKYASGETNILVIRYKNKPNEPFFTVEVKDNSIKQVHGKRNCNPKNEVAEFIELFKIEKLKSKKVKLTA